MNFNLSKMFPIVSLASFLSSCGTEEPSPVPPKNQIVGKQYDQQQSNPMLKKLLRNQSIDTPTELEAHQTMVMVN